MFELSASTCRSAAITRLLLVHVPRDSLSSLTLPPPLALRFQSAHESPRSSKPDITDNTSSGLLVQASVRESFDNEA